MILNKNVIRNVLWVFFFTMILLSWAYIYNMSISMGLNWTGKMVMPTAMDSMITFKMLFSMWFCLLL